MNHEFEPLDGALEQAMDELQNNSPSPEEVEAAAARVWAHLESARRAGPIEGCEGFRDLFPGFRAGTLSEAQTLLLKDHLHECVACRREFEGRVVPIAHAPLARQTALLRRWAVAAAVVVGVGLGSWFAWNGGLFSGAGQAVVVSADGGLYTVSGDHLQTLSAGAPLPQGVEVRTAAGGGAVLRLRDGSTIELRERSSLTTTEGGPDATVALRGGSIMVQAAKRASGHLYVTTADCRVAVTGTVFSVSTGIKGSRVSVVQGEVRVSENNRERVLHPGEQTVTGQRLDQQPLAEDLAWSRNQASLVQQVEAVRKALAQIPLPSARTSSALLGRLPADTVFVASLPNLKDYLGKAQSLLGGKMAENKALGAWWQSHTSSMGPMMQNMRAAGEYLGDEILLVSLKPASGTAPEAPVMVAEARRPGFAEMVRSHDAKAIVEIHGGIAVAGQSRASVTRVGQALDRPSGGFASTPLYAKLSAAYRNGVGILLGSDLAQLGQAAPEGPRFFLAGQKQVEGTTETRVTLSFDGAPTGMAGWLAAPAPMRALDYISQEAGLVAAFVVKQPASIIDQVLAVQQRSSSGATDALAAATRLTGTDIRGELGASLGGEFTLALDGSIIPVPSWKLVAEVPDPVRFEATLRKLIEAYNRDAVARNQKPVRTAEEIVDGRTYHMIGAPEANPLTEVRYTFSEGYLIAGPTSAVVTRALQVKASGTGIAHSREFQSRLPRDTHTSFSALVYQNLGGTLAPLAGLFSAFAQKGGGQTPNLASLRPFAVAAYGGGDHITIAADDPTLSLGLNLVSGDLGAISGGLMPMGRNSGTRSPKSPFK